MSAVSIRAAVAQVGAALREPDRFALSFHRAGGRLDPRVVAALLGAAAFGTTSYGMTMGILGGAGRILELGFLCTLAAGLAWLIPLPGLYVLNCVFGSRLPLRSTLLAAAVTVSFGGLALLASIPINWFFTVTVPVPWFVLAVNLVVFAGVGTTMVDVFGRVMRALEPARGRAPTLLLLPVVVLGVEFFHAFGLFRFGQG
ncbi:MAG: hypothetical protein R3F56_25185 [Planctomycetota bacterium]